MSQPEQWVLMAYRMPREPSTPRIAVWRKLKALGVAQLLDGLVALPLDARNREQFEWLAQEIEDVGGQSMLWIAQPTLGAEQRTLRQQLASRISEEYAHVIEQAEQAAGDSPAAARRSLARLRRELGRIRRRDYFPPAERERAELAVERLAGVLTEAPR